MEKKKEMEGLEEEQAGVEQGAGESGMGDNQEKDYQQKGTGSENEAGPTEDEQKKDLQEQLLRQTAEAEELKLRVQRLQADFENFRRRSKKDLEEMARYGAERVVSSFLPIIDNFERALEAAEKKGEATQLVTGVEMIYRQLKEALEKEGLQVIPAENEPFNPERHNAVLQVVTDEYEDNIIVEELQKGYLLYDKVLRPSMVKVAKNEGSQ